MVATDRVGYWGTPTSSIDWCESNYVVSFYIAEFFNTISSFVAVIAAAYIFVVAHRYNQRSIQIVAILYAVIGCGSAMFHGTLLFEAQLFDELPMIYFQTAVYLVQMRFKTVYCVIAFLLIVPYTAFHIVFRPVALFQFIFGVMVLLSAYPALRHARMDLIETHLGIRFVATLLISITLWKLDQRFCPELEKLYLHAWWHVGSSYAVVCGLLSVIYSKLRETGGARLTFAYGIPTLARIKVE